jgi:predicted short-subunit dehydrogenase-like oxidoreductase (DUF2520 family)
LGGAQVSQLPNYQITKLLNCLTPKPSIGLVGAGSLAAALAPALHQAGYRITEIVSRDQPRSRRRARRLAETVGARPVTMATAQFPSPLLWLCVSDSAIAGCARDLAGRTNWAGKIAFHSSGALSADALDPLRQRGAWAASLHPMMSFVPRSRPSLKGIGFAVEGDSRAAAVASRVARDLGGTVFRIRRADKVLYHAWASFASPLLVTLLAVGEEVAGEAGIKPAAAKRIIQPIVRRTIDNYFAHGAAAAFSGPLVRGDLATVHAHLRQLRRIPQAKEVYRLLARTALANLPVAKRQQMAALLKATSQKGAAENKQQATSRKRQARKGH